MAEAKTEGQSMHNANSLVASAVASALVASAVISRAKNPF